ncbi:MAG: single-stranded-DNA-specific exonuclease RecJ, partial [Pedosphaera parvula]|nr:single-stranded-DNA-specific exonuclease RecJ [Pedosphaera parvula]
SCRSIEGFALHEALAECAEVLETHGGHAMAAGCSLRTENLVRFRERMNACASRRLASEGFRPRLLVDDEVAVGALTQAVVREVGRLAPHGAGNPEPVLAAKDVRIAGEPRLMGKKGDHLSFFVAQGESSVRAVGFGMGELYEPLLRADTCSIAFTPQINEWNGRTSVELRLEDVKIGEK